MSDLTKIEICVDCLMVLANGEAYDDKGEDITESVVAHIEDMWDGARLLLGGSDQGFSWRDCEACGSRLGGDRFSAYADSE